MTDERRSLDLFDDEEYDDEDEARQERHRKRRPGLIILLVCVLLLLIPVGIVAYYGGSALSAFNGITRDSELNPEDYEGRPEEATPQEGTSNPPINFVLMGSDARADDYSGRSDSLMVAHLSGDRQHLYLISFPRDMWVDIPGQGKGKINWAYSQGGAPLTVRTLEELTGTRMDHTVAIDFEGFIQLTDALGGVTVYNPWPSGQAGNRFPRGEITISGERALAYVRERTTLPNGDLDRAYRQRTVVRAIVREVVTTETLTNPGKFNDVVTTFADALTVDESITLGFVTGLAPELRLQGSEGVRMLQAPISGFGTAGDQSIVVVDEAKLAEMSEALRTDSMDAYYRANPSTDNPEPVETEGEEGEG